MIDTLIDTSELGSPSLEVAPLPVAPKLRPPKKLHWSIPVLFFGLLTAFFTYPTVFHFNEAVSGVGVEDRLQNLWNFWWLRQALTHGQFPYLTDALFFPYYQAPRNALPLYFHDLQAFNGLVTLPLQLMSGVAAAYNGVVFGATMVSGLATYWLIRRLGGSIGAALIGGAIYAFAPIRRDAIAQSITNIQSTEFLPLYALLLHLARFTNFESIRFWANLNKKWVVGAILALTFCIYTDWYNTIYLLFYSLFYFGWRVWQGSHTFRQLKREISFMLLIAGGTFILVAPLLLPSITNLNNPDFRITPGYDRELKSAANLSSFFLPGAIGSNWDTCLLSYSGLILAALAILFLFQRQKPPKSQNPAWLSPTTCLYWLLLSGGALVMALGPELKLSSELNTGLPLPYALFRQLPVVSVTRDPSRFVILAMLGIAVLAAFTLDWLRTSNGLARLLHFVKPSRRAGLAGGLLTALTLGLLILESWSPLPLFEVKNNPFMESLAKEQGDFYLLELPITRHYNHDQVRMFNQIAHGRPILGGYLSRPVVDPYRSPDSPFAPLAELIIRQKRQPPDIIPLSTNQEDLDTLVALYNFHYIVLYLNEFDDPYQLAGVTDLISNHYGSQQLVYKDETMAVYQVPDEHLEKSRSYVKLTLGSGWSPLEYDTNKDMWRWTGANSPLYATTFAAQKMHLKLTLNSFEVDRRLQINLNGEAIFQSIVPNAATTLEVDLSLVEGRNELRLISLDGDQSPQEIYQGSKDTRRLAFAVHSIELAG